jgi:hypothetical protein
MTEQFLKYILIPNLFKTYTGGTVTEVTKDAIEYILDWNELLANDKN